MIRLPKPLPRVWAGSRRMPVAAVMVSLVAQAGVLALAAWLTRSLFVALGSSAGAAQPGATGWDSTAAWPAAALAGCAAVLYALRVVERQAAEHLAQDYVQQVRRTLLGRIAGLGQSQLQQQLLRQVMARLSGDMSALQQWIAQGTPRLLAAGLTLPVFAAVLLLIDPVLAAAALAPLLLALVLLAAAGPRLGATYRAVRRSRGRLAMDTLERLRIAPALRSAGGLGRELRALRLRAEALEPESRRKGRWTALVRHLPELGTGFAGACVLGVALWQGRSTADAAASLAALGLLAHTLNQLAGVWDRWHAWRASSRFLERALRARPTVRAAPAPMRADEAGPPPGGRTGTDLVERIRSLPPGARVNLSGPTGTGKSHLLRTLAGLEGRGRDAAPGIERQALQPAPSVLLVSALGPWLRGSLDKNLTFGVVDAQGRAQAARAVIEALGLQRLRDRLAEHGERVQEHGANLSTRERFLVLLARAWTRPPDLLLVDLGDWPIDPALRGHVIRLLEHAPQTTLVCVSSEPVDWGGATQQWSTAPQARSVASLSSLPPGRVAATG